MESGSCSDCSVLLVAVESECIVPMEIAVTASQFICKSLPTKRDLTLTIVMCLTLARSFFFFFCLNVISCYWCTNWLYSCCYPPCIFPSGISDGDWILIPSSNNPLYCYPETSVNFIELLSQTLTPAAGASPVLNLEYTQMSGHLPLSVHRLI